MNGHELFLLFQQYPRICTDTRKIKEGDLFFALRGDRFDGNKYAAQALEKGAAYAIIDDPQYANTEDARFILVSDSLKALQELARNYRKTFQIPFLGITGSNGKTTSKELIRSVLASEKKVYATSGNLNNHIGVPLTLLAMPQDTEIAIIEMGTNQPGDIRELVDIALPTDGLITNIGAAHLERLGNIAGVREEKGALFREVIEKGGTIFLNEGDAELRKLRGNYDRAISFGEGSLNYTVEVKNNTSSGMEISVESAGWKSPEIFHLNLSGSFNALNALAAIAVGEYFGISINGIRQGLGAYISQNNRSQMLERGGFQIYLDAYNANPSSMKAAIANVFEIQEGKTTLILGDMFELGTEEKQLHAELGSFINSFSPAVCIGIGPLMKHLIDEVNGKTHWFQDVEAARPSLLSLLKDTELILIKGSRGMALERLLEEFP